MNYYWDLMELLRWFWTVTMLVASIVLFFYLHLPVLAILIAIRELVAIAILQIEREVC